MGGEHHLQCLGQILQQVETIRDLYRPGRALAGALGISAGAVACDHLDAGMLPEPCRKRTSLAVRQKRQGTVPGEVHQHGAVGVPRT